jgi:hypothetical protein
MRKHKRTIALALALISLVSVGALGIAPAQAAEPDRHVTVTGVGTISVVPDAVRFYPSVTALAAKSGDALATASKTASAVRAALKTQGIATKDIKSSNLSVFPEYNYTQDKGSVIVGYRATQSFTVVIRKADTAGKVVEAVVNAGNENVMINGIVRRQWKKLVLQQLLMLVPALRRTQSFLELHLAKLSISKRTLRLRIHSPCLVLQKHKQMEVLQKLISEKKKSR